MLPGWIESQECGGMLRSLKPDDVTDEGEKRTSYVQITKLFARKIVNIFLPISLNKCFGCSKEPSHWDGSFEYPQHMFSLRNKQDIIQYLEAYDMCVFVQRFRTGKYFWW